MHASLTRHRRWKWSAIRNLDDGAKAAYARGRWRAFSKLCGYADEEMRTFDKFLDLNSDCGNRCGPDYRLGHKLICLVCLNSLSDDTRFISREWCTTLRDNLELPDTTLEHCNDIKIAQAAAQPVRVSMPFRLIASVMTGLLVLLIVGMRDGTGSGTLVSWAVAMLASGVALASPTYCCRC